MSFRRTFVICFTVATLSITGTAFNSLNLALNARLCRVTTLNSHKVTSDVRNRRSFLHKAAGTFAITSIVSLGNIDRARAEEDLYSQLYNADGSLKEGSNISTEATSRPISVSFPESDTGEAIVYADEILSRNFDSDSNLKVSYQLPTKWTNDTTYTDTTVGVNLPACNRIFVYQTPGKISSKVLEKATMTGVAKALQTQSSGNLNLKGADLVAGKKSEKDGNMYWNFDLAVAPLKCEGEKKQEDLGLGFCPYDSIGKRVCIGSKICCETT